jgi:peptidoglycan hydrolase-like protein with peptidoglycan-binding domain
MARIPGLIFLLGTAFSLGACTSDQLPPPLPQSMYQNNPGNIRKVQIALRDRGDYAGFVDGYLGQYTGDGIQRFEVEHCLRVKPVIDRSLLVSLGIAND